MFLDRLTWFRGQGPLAKGLELQFPRNMRNAYADKKDGESSVVLREFALIPEAPRPLVGEPGLYSQSSLRV